MAFNSDFNNGYSNENAYYNAIARNIQKNGAKTALKKWLLEADDHQEIYNWLKGIGEYALNPKTGETHPLRNRMYEGKFGIFLLKMSQILADNGGAYDFGEEVKWWGKLSPKQTDIVRKALVRAKEYYAKRDDRQAKRDAESAKRKYVGEIGDKKFEVKGKVAFVLDFDSNWGTTYLTIVRDADDNTIKYMGNFIADKDEEVSMIATIKAHEEYKGEKQTIVNRPRNIEIREGA